MQDKVNTGTWRPELAAGISNPNHPNLSSGSTTVTGTQEKYWLHLTAAVAGVVLVCLGLSLAALSNPGRFSLDPRADTQIQLMAVAGFACTIAGVGLLLTAVRRTTKSMPAQLRTKTNIGVGIGFALQVAGLYLCGTGQLRALVGLVLIFASLPALVWGCLSYAEGKGYLKWVGLLGAAGILGLGVLMVLPDRRQQVA